MTRVAVVGHVEWVDFVPVERFPKPGEIIHASGAFARAAGGGGVVAVVLAELGADVDLLIVDLRELRFMDSTGLHALVKANKRAGEAGQRFAVVKGGAQIQRLLSLTGVGELLIVADSPEELLRAG